MPRRSPLPRELFEEYSEKLEALLDERDDVAEKRRSISKALKGELSILDGRVSHVRRVLKGHEAPQLEIPGTEIGEWKRDSIIERILGWAAKIKQQRDHEDAKRSVDEVKEDLAQETGGVDFSAWKKGVLIVPGGEYHVVEDDGTYALEWHEPEKEIQEVLSFGFETPIAAKSAAVKDWKGGRGKKNGVPEKRAKPKKAPGLDWMKQEDGGWFAMNGEGAYYLTRALDGQWTADWAPRDGERQAVVSGFGLPEKQAKGACETHHLQLTAPPLPLAPTNGVEKKPEPPALVWKWTREDVQSAEGVGGSYELERLAAGGFKATFRKTKAKKAQMIVLGDPEPKAKEACVAHHVERFTDAMLANAGAAGLVKGDLRGPAQKHKKGRK